MNLYDKKTETASPRRIREAQLNDLRWTLLIAKNSALYRDKLAGRARIRCLDDLQRLPFTTKDELRQAYPYGALAVPRERVVYYCSTSGTTGRPTAVHLTGADVERLSYAQARSFYSAGIRSRDSAQLMVHPMMGFLFEAALHRIGAMSILTGPGNDAGQVALIRELKVTTLFGVPSYLLHLGGIAEGVESVERVVALGEPLTANIRERLGKQWGAEVYNDYGSVETAAGFLECGQHDGHHIFWDHFLIETVDPETLEPTTGRGELVITTLKREATPLIRYRTRDMVRIDYDPCACGRTHPRIYPERRLGEMVKIKGTAVYPSALMEAVAGIGEINSYQFIVQKEGDLDTLLLRIEADRPSPELARRTAETVKAASNITPRVEFVEEGSLLGERKAKHFVDMRTA